jgi:phosphomethylpyrimidine synthase
MKISQDIRAAAAAQNDVAVAEAGMAEMSERFREVGSELSVGANGREHD